MSASSAPFEPRSHPSPQASLSTLPDDILIHIISLLPSLPPETTSHHLKEAYEILSLARVQQRYAYFSNSQVENVTSIDPFPDVSHVAPIAHLPPYARPRFLAFLVALCRNLDTLRAPRLRGVLQYAGEKLRDISFVDTGLSDPDLLFLSRSSLRYASIKNPSPPVLTALAQVRTLEHVSLRRISEDTLPHVVNFLACTSAKSLYASVTSASDEPLLALLQGLPPLDNFVLKCEVHQLWALRYLRRIARLVKKVEMFVGGVTIVVEALDERDTNCTKWDNEVMKRLICRKDFGEGELSTMWRDCMTIREIDLEVFQQAVRQGVSEEAIHTLISHYIHDDERDFEEIHVRLGRILSMKSAIDRLDLIAITGIRKHVTSLQLPQDIVQYAWKRDREFSVFLRKMLNDFSEISTLQLCTPGEGRLVSSRLVMGLPNFLRTAIECCPQLSCVYLEKAGELVLQNAGMPALTDETKVKGMINAVIVAIRELETEESVEMGTVIAQLEFWTSSDLRVVDGKDVDDVACLDGYEGGTMMLLPSC